MNDIIEFDQKKVQQFRQSNALVESVYQATLTEKRILATMVSMIRPDDVEFKDYKIDIKKFQEVFDIKGKSILDLVKKSTKNLLSRTIQINDGDKFLQINWISSAEYQKGSSHVVIRFDPKLKPYLLNLRGGYTTALLDQVAKFKSVYAFRLYELFKQYYPRIDKREFEVLHLKRLLGCENEYPNYANFKDKVINKAVYEINHLSDLNITFLELKEARKVKNIIFEISKKGQPIVREIESSKKVIVQEIRKAFLERTSENIKAYFVEKSYKADPEQFEKNHQKRGWKGIIDWTAAADEWEIRHKEMFPDKYIVVGTTSTSKPIETETPEIKAIRDQIKLKLEIADKRDAQVLFYGPITKTETGFAIEVTNTKALQYQEILNEINVKILCQ